MPGGLLNLVSEGTQNVFLTGNPHKTFFKTTYIAIYCLHSYVPHFCEIQET